eukprot:scaffold4058_cov121-Isochrysis_galbana.AAC.4
MAEVARAKAERTFARAPQRMKASRTAPERAAAHPSHATLPPHARQRAAALHVRSERREAAAFPMPHPAARRSPRRAEAQPAPAEAELRGGGGACLGQAERRARRRCHGTQRAAHESVMAQAREPLLSPRQRLDAQRARRRASAPHGGGAAGRALCAADARGVNGARIASSAPQSPQRGSRCVGSRRPRQPCHGSAHGRPPPDRPPPRRRPPQANRSGRCDGCMAMPQRREPELAPMFRKGQPFFEQRARGVPPALERARGADAAKRTRQRRRRSEGDPSAAWALRREGTTPASRIPRATQNSARLGGAAPVADVRRAPPPTGRAGEHSNVERVRCGRVLERARPPGPSCGFLIAWHVPR